MMGEFFVDPVGRGPGSPRPSRGEVLAASPRPWVIPFQNENPRAAAFWRRLAAEVLDDVAEQTIAVPGKAHLPPDVWLAGRNLPPRECVPLGHPPGADLS